jgi:hypothetical protein
MAPGDDSDLADLVGRQAAAWWRHRRWGGELLDHGLAAVETTFGPKHTIGAWVPSDPRSGLHTDFYLLIRGRVERQRDWQRILSVYEQLDLVRENNTNSAFRRAMARFHPVLIRLISESTTPHDVVGDWIR